ncbi:MAG TPA: class I lanthipeptide [Kofleriaceae bacterium]|nr:class I lanthipeptide [Kofleriaceae bacterium]
MKKSTTKLQLKKSTVRFLQDNVLAGVHGGADAFRGGPTNDIILCFQGQAAGDTDGRRA